MSEIESWISDAGREAGRNFAQCSPELAGKIVKAAREKFVKDNPRVWWIGLKHPYTAIASANLKLTSILPRTVESVWFIPETDEDALPVYDVSPNDIDLIRRLTPPFEYYVLDKAWRWLIIESDHDEFIVCSSTSKDS